MTDLENRGYRIIQINEGVIGPRAPRQKTVQVKTISDYPDISKPYLEVAQIYADKKMAGGVPICDELIALVLHLFTEEEASVMKHLKPLLRQTAKSLADAEHLSTQEVEKILHSLANEKHIVLHIGEGDESVYMSIPILPGVFEFVLARQSIDSLTDWHRRFCQLFDRLYKTGYIVDREIRKPPAVKYLPIGKVIRSNPAAFPSDKLEEVFSRYRSFGLTLCQCRVMENVLGRGCGKPMEVCVTLGPLAEMSIRGGRSRRITMKDALEIKAEAEANGLVTWIDASDPRIGGTSCSCCGDCCHFMRRVTEFNSPASIAPPHFTPKIDPEKCNYCGQCALSCPMAATTIDLVNKKYTLDANRCIGCAQCVAACSKNKAIEMAAVSECEEFQQNGIGVFF